MRAHQARILRLCASLLGDPTLAEDAAQEIFFKAYRALPSFRGQSAFSTWLYRIASDVCLDLLRKRRSRVPPALSASRRAVPIGILLLPLDNK